MSVFKLNCFGVLLRGRGNQKSGARVGNLGGSRRVRRCDMEMGGGSVARGNGGNMTKGVRKEEVEAGERERERERET